MNKHWIELLNEAKSEQERKGLTKLFEMLLSLRQQIVMREKHLETLK